MGDVQLQGLDSDYDIDKILNSSRFLTPVTGFDYDDLGNDVLPLGIYKDSAGVWHDFQPASALSGFTIQPVNVVDIYSSRVATEFAGSSAIIPKFVLIAIKGKEYTNQNFFKRKNEMVTSPESYMKIHLQGEYDTTTAAQTTTEVTHGLGYIPMINVWVKNISSGFPNYINRITTSGDSAGLTNGVIIDEQKIYITTGLVSPSRNITVYYRIYLENQE